MRQEIEMFWQMANLFVSCRCYDFCLPSRTFSGVCWTSTLLMWPAIGPRGQIRGAVEWVGLYAARRRSVQMSGEAYQDPPQ